MSAERNNLQEQINYVRSMVHTLHRNSKQKFQMNETKFNRKLNEINNNLIISAETTLDHNESIINLSRKQENMEENMEEKHFELTNKVHRNEYLIDKANINKNKVSMRRYRDYECDYSATDWKSGAHFIFGIIMDKIIHPSILPNASQKLSHLIIFCNNHYLLNINDIYFTNNNAINFSIIPLHNTSEILTFGCAESFKRKETWFNCNQKWNEFVNTPNKNYYFVALQYDKRNGWTKHINDKHHQPRNSHRTPLFLIIDKNLNEMGDNNEYKMIFNKNDWKNMASYFPNGKKQPVERELRVIDYKTTNNNNNNILGVGDYIYGYGYHNNNDASASYIPETIRSESQLLLPPLPPSHNNINQTVIAFDPNRPLFMGLDRTSDVSGRMYSGEHGSRYSPHDIHPFHSF